MEFFKGKSFKLTCATLALSAGFGLTAPSFSASAAELEKGSSYSQNPSEKLFSKEQLDQLKPMLEAIENVPDQLLEEGNTNEINQYFHEKNVDIKVSNGVNEVNIERVGGTWECSVAIGELIVTNAIPIAKLAKIKKYVKALGGAWETAKLLVGATNAGEKWAMVTALMAELSGFTDVKNECGF